jgi:xanthine dehydrogenase accessory factor
VRELLDDLDAWRREGRRIALARVVDIEGSGPRDAGAAMAVDGSGEVIGSVSGGCVEGAVVEAALEVLAGTAPSRIVTFGYSDDEAFSVGLTCGGTVHLFIQPLDWHEDVWRAFADAVRDDRPVALATVVEGPGTGSVMVVEKPGRTAGSLGGAELDRIAARDTVGEQVAARTLVRGWGTEGQSTPEDHAATETVRVFLESFAPPPAMWIFGAVDFTAALARVAKVLGYRVTVCDAREVFATKRRFPMADEVVVSWPDAVFADRGARLGPRDAVCILTHDPKFDVPAVRGALATGVGYIGVMGSRATHERRLARLAEAGIDDPRELARLHSPIGLDLGGRTPEETAVAIVGEIIAVRTGRSAVPLSRSAGPIH